MTDILIIGAGASGLMAARELAKVGKKVLILEARQRIGGRILPLSETDFGFPAQGGAEFVHGAAPVTKALIREIGLTFIPEEGEIWSARNGGELIPHASFIQDNEILKQKLADLCEDMPIARFLDENFGGEKYAALRNSITTMVEGYDAADPKRISSFILRDEWIGAGGIENGRIKEGYGPVLAYLESECKKLGVEIRLGEEVQSITLRSGKVLVETKEKKTYEAEKAIVTVPLPLLQKIEFDPEFRTQIAAASKIGFGHAIKAVIRFKSRWWDDALGKDLSNMAYMLCNEPFMTWWTQYPETQPVLVGWMAGPEAAKHDSESEEELLQLALSTLARIFKKDMRFLKDQVAVSKVTNWVTDPFTKGAYSYTTSETKDAYDILIQPMGGSIFIAGEALYRGEKGSTATVEGALGSAIEVVQRILR